MYNSKKGNKLRLINLISILGINEIFYKFGKITWNRFFMEVRYPWTLLNAFGMGLAAIKHFYIIHGKYG